MNLLSPLLHFAQAFWPALLLLGVGIAVGSFRRWTKQRPLSRYNPEVLQNAFALNPTALAHVRRRGSLSLRELSRALRLTRRLLQQELRTRQ